MSKIVCVKKFRNRLQAELAKSLLEAEGIMAQVSADDSGGMEMMPIQLVGSVELLVLEDRLHEASSILNKRTRQEQKMKILVTGATGFIGGRTVEALLTLSYDEVRCCGRNRSKAERLEKQGACFYEGSLLDGKHLEEITRDIDIIVHCAGLAGTWGKYQDYHQANVTATEKLIAAAQENGTKRFVNISSPSIYFDYCDQFDLVEGDLPKRFSNHYAATKFKAEKVVEKAHNEKFLTVSLRPRFVIGAGDNQIIPRLIRLQQSKMLVQIGDGKNIVDITTVKNVVDAILLCLQAPASAMGEVYNISNGAPVKFWEFVDMVLTKMGLATEKKKLPYRLMLRLARVNQMVAICVKRKEEPRLLPIAVAALAKSMTLNISKAREKLGYDPQQSLEEGVDEFLAWWREQKQAVENVDQDQNRP